MGQTGHDHGEWAFDLTGGRASLDFVNTVGGTRLRAPVERLHEYGDLVSWGRQSGALSAGQAARLSAEALRRPGEAAAALRRAVELREALFRLFRAVAERSEPPADDLALLNGALSRALAHQRLFRDRDRYRLGFAEGEPNLDAVLWPVARSAAGILASDEIERVRICEATAAGECDWVFLDETRNRTRRWCSMKSCGNRAKARRHYQRIRAKDR